MKRLSSLRIGFWGICVVAFLVGGVAQDRKEMLEFSVFFPNSGDIGSLFYFDGEGEEIEVRIDPWGPAGGYEITMGASAVSFSIKEPAEEVEGKAVLREIGRVDFDGIESEALILFSKLPSTEQLQYRSIVLDTSESKMARGSFLFLNLTDVKLAVLVDESSFNIGPFESELLRFEPLDRMPHQISIGVQQDSEIKVVYSSARQSNPKRVYLFALLPPESIKSTQLRVGAYAL